MPLGGHVSAAACSVLRPSCGSVPGALLPSSRRLRISSRHQRLRSLGVGHNFLSGSMIALAPCSCLPSLSNASGSLVILPSADKSSKIRASAPGGTSTPSARSLVYIVTLSVVPTPPGGRFLAHPSSMSAMIFVFRSMLISLYRTPYATRDGALGPMILCHQDRRSRPPRADTHRIRRGAGGTLPQDGRRTEQAAADTCPPSGIGPDGAHLSGESQHASRDRVSGAVQGPHSHRGRHREG